MLTLVFFLAFPLMCGNRVSANPYIDTIEVTPPVSPSITILSPAENNTLNNSNELTISFNATIRSENVETWITRADYNASWQPNNIVIWQGSDQYLPEYTFNLSLTEIPEGKQTVTITAYGNGGYSQGAILYVFHAVSSYTVGFTVDTAPPVVSILELDNKTLFEAPLNLVTGEAVSKISYVLDGQKNVTITGNITLTGLPIGAHDMIVYVWDAAGNVGKSETASFTITESFPSMSVLVVAVVVGMVVAGAGFLLYRKRGRGKTQ